MSDVLGARIGSDDPQQIAEVQGQAPQTLAIGTKPTATTKQASRAGAVYDDRGYLEGRDPRTMSQDELVAMGIRRCPHYRRSALIVSIVEPARARGGQVQGAALPELAVSDGDQSVADTPFRRTATSDARMRSPSCPGKQKSTLARKTIERIPLPIQKEPVENR
jgi:hypothetical protein